MSLRDKLAALLGSRREAAPAAAAEPAPPPVEPAAPRPRIVLLGTEPRAIGLIEIYGLGGRDDVALSDRRPGRDAGEAWGHRVLFDRGLVRQLLSCSPELTAASPPDRGCFRGRPC